MDNNVTQHIQHELNYNDWTMMILHYLGLDHIGHVEGPFGTSIKPKLQEMDKIINQIAQRVQYWVSNFYFFFLHLINCLIKLSFNPFHFLFCCIICLYYICFILLF